MEVVWKLFQCLFLPATTNHGDERHQRIINRTCHLATNSQLELLRFFGEAADSISYGEFVNPVPHGSTNARPPSCRPGFWARRSIKNSYSLLNGLKLITDGMLRSGRANLIVRWRDLHR